MDLPQHYCTMTVDPGNGGFKVIHASQTGETCCQSSAGMWFAIAKAGSQPGSGRRDRSLPARGRRFLPSVGALRVVFLTFFTSLTDKEEMTRCTRELQYWIA
jgi:hypothetical protein